MTANFGRYARFILRRDRVACAFWLAGPAVFMWLIATVYPGLLPDDAAMYGMAATMNTPAMVALMGPVYGIDALTPAIIMAQECLIWVALSVIVMNIFFINRYTRADEELGRFEMTAALPVGRLTNGAAAIALAFALNAAASALVALFILAAPLSGVTAAGAFAYGFSIGAQGFVFAAVTLLTAQLFSTARGASGSAFALMGVSYALRAQGDMSGNILSYISPLGLGLKAEAFHTNNFTPVIALLLEGVVIAGIALAINAKRDVGAGVFPARKGRADASVFLQSPLGFAWRLSRNTFIAWAAGVFAISAVYGSVIGELDDFVADNEMISQILGDAGTLSDAYIAMLNCIMALVASIPLINCINRLRGEEKRGRIETVLAAAVPRFKLFGSFALIAAAQAIAFTLLGAFGLYAAARGTGLVTFGVLLKAAFAYLPALLVMAALAALLAGCAPRLSALIWVLFGYEFLMFYFGRLFDIPRWAVRISPFENIPQIPLAAVSAAPLTALCVIAAALCAAGFAGYRRRDVGR